MNKLFFILCCFLSTHFIAAQPIVGKWKCVANYSSFDNKKTNMEAALHQSRPCTKNTIYDFQSDGKVVRTYLDCDQKYVETQNKIWKKQQWKLEGNTLKISVTNFSICTKYNLTFSVNKMTWTNNEETIVYEKL